jgi:hypothetical protein
MTFVKKIARFASPLAISVLVAASNNATAGLKNLNLAVSLETKEFITLPNQPNGVACPAGVPVAGITSGVGTITIKSGKTLYSGPVFINATDCAIPGATSFQFLGGNMTLTLTNSTRDTMTATYSGSFLQSAPSSTTYNINSGSLAITGGTGVFDGASGTATLSGMETIIPGAPSFAGAMNAKGSISFSKTTFEQLYGQGN